jgi:peptidoglycan/xylan/chitin deacetylase (PgdA/CDA1 family)
MYHHIDSDRFSNDLELFERHLQYIADRFEIVLPGDTLSGERDALCLTFDDAYFDFYHYVYPLLQKYHTKALLAVPTAYILEETRVDPAKRLSVQHDRCYQEEVYREFAPFCTWSELREMGESGLVYLASHSHNHCDLTLPDTDLYEEIVTSRHILEAHLGEKIESFVLPFGRYNRKSIELLRDHYRYIFKVGQGVNPDFDGIHGLIYRIDGDDMTDERSIFSTQAMLGYRLKSMAKRLHDGILNT